ncbi:hypothetical protein Pcinc_041654 [Petrolisthes cinctipes]|uniref:Uncharacterized protein n=1 Tax=Petrolisthes cinctipes TaxID=88211 RepID=A0AAE1EI50_PETCI|nr:hypothetical protein Pcinc_041654 [Petrolisthes cinctipes]
MHLPDTDTPPPQLYRHTLLSSATYHLHRHTTTFPIHHIYQTPTHHHHHHHHHHIHCSSTHHLHRTLLSFPLSHINDASPPSPPPHTLFTMVISHMHHYQPTTHHHHQRKPQPPTNLRDQPTHNHQPFSCTSTQQQQTSIHFINQPPTLLKSQPSLPNEFDPYHQQPPSLSLITRR